MHTDEVKPNLSEIAVAPAGVGKERSDRWLIAAVGLMLLAHAGLACDCARRLSVTHDEYWHLPVGLLSWQTRAFDFDAMNPPLTRLWAAIPLACAGVAAGPADRVLSPGERGDAFLGANPPYARYERLLAWGRFMTVVLSVFTGILLATWSYALFGRGACCLTLWLWSMSPCLIANGSLVTPDMGLTLLFTAVLYSLWRFALRPTWPRALVWGALLGLAQAAKFTALLLYPLCPLLWLLLTVGAGREKPPRRIRLIGQWLGGLGLSLGVLNFAYLFHGTMTPIAAYEFRSRALAELSHAPGWLGALPVPLPRDYVVGLDQQRAIMESPHPVYLDGEWSTSGFRRYYLMVLAYKLPHAVQALCLLAGLWLIFPKRELRQLRSQLFLLLPIGALMIVASLSGMQLGLRYVLPVVPLLLLWAGQAARWCGGARNRVRTALVVACAAACPFSLRYHPHHLAYFNEGAGGPIGGRWRLVDSNLDWGQALNHLQEFLEDRQVSQVGLAYFGTLPPAATGLRYQLPPSWAPAPGWYAISVNYVQGRPHILRRSDGTAQAAALDEFGYFRFFQPTATIGGAIDVYHLTGFDVLRWHAARNRVEP